MEYEPLVDATETLTMELLCRLSLVLCELEALNERMASAPATDQPFLRASLQDARIRIDGVVSFLSTMPLEESRH